MQAKKMIALVVGLVLAFCSFAVAYAEATENETVVEPTTFYAASTDTDVQAPEQTISPDKTNAVTTEQRTVTPVATEESSPVETPSVQSETPAATQQPTETATDSATPAVVDATATPAPQTQPARSASIQVEVPSNPKYGDTVTLKATLSGYDGSAVQLQWQYSKDQENWVNASGNNASSTQYSFKISAETVCTYWRLAVTAD